MNDQLIKTQLEATQQTVKFFETLLHSSVDGIVITDVMQNIIVVNEAFCSFFGKYPKDVVETSIFIWLDQLNTDAPDHWAEMEKQVRLKGLCRDTEFQLLGQGETSHFNVNASLLEQVAEEEVGIIISVWHDITRQKQIEEAFRESEEQYRLLFETMISGFSLLEMVYDENGKPIDCRYVRVNPSHQKQSGLNSSQIIGKTAKEVFGLKEEWIEAYGRVDKTGDPIMIEDYAEGLGKWFKVVAYRPKPGFVAVMFDDITHLKQAEETRRESEEKYRILFENSIDACYITTREGDIIEANQAHLDLFGYTREEIFDWKSKDTYVNPDDISRFKKEIEENGFVKDFEVELQKKDGTEMDCLITATLRQSKEGGIAGYQGIIRDVTEFNRAEQALRESEERYREFVEGTDDLITQVDSEGRFVYVNRTAERIYGINPDQCVGISAFDFVHPEDQDRTKDAFNGWVRDRQRSVTFENRQINRTTGKVSHMYWTINFHFDEKRKLTGIKGIARDLTDQKKLEAQILDTLKMEAIGTLAGGIAHEFNNALTSIVGNIELLELRLPDNKIVTEHTGAMKSSSHRMANLTSQLLAYAEGGRYQAKTMSLSDFVGDTLPIITPNIDPSIRLETDLPRDIFSVEADPTQMQMVLSAVVSNSSEAIEGEGRIRITVSNKEIDAMFVKNHSELNPGKHVCLTVEDDGKGMDAETLNKIFDPFFTTKFTGRGLGMAAVYGIIRNHDGWISVDSELNKGTIIRIYLPAIEAEEVKKEAIVESVTEMPKGEGTILIIEDEEMVMNVLRAVLERLGYRMLEAKTGREAVEIAKTFDGDIDLALLDIKLPDIPGDKVYPLIMKARPNLKVIVCSGYSIDTARGILDAGAQDFIQKPFSVETLSKKLKEVLEGR